MQMINCLRAYLVSTKGPRRELSEQPCFLGWTRCQRFRENVKVRLLQALADDFLRNGCHDAFQHAEVLVVFFQKLSAVSHSHVHGEIQSVGGERALWVVVVPTTEVDSIRNE